MAEPGRQRRMFTAWTSESSGDFWSPSCRSGPHTRHPIDAMLPPAQGDDGSRNPVLVLSSDPLAAALLGAAIELAGLAPRFAQSAETPRNAPMRVRPCLVLIDCDHEEACAEAFVGPALMTGSQVVLFRSRRTRRDVSEMVDRLGLRMVDMPREHDSLTSLLHELVL